MTKKSVILIIFIALFFFLAGFFSSYFLLKKGASSQCRSEFKNGWDAAKKKLVDKGILPNGDTSLLNITGTVEKVTDNELLIKAAIVDPLQEELLDERLIKIEKNTKIYKIVQKDEKEYQKEMEEYFNNERRETDRTSATGGGPTNYYEKEIEINEVKVNDRVEVFAGENIRNEKNITAQKIIVQI